MTLRRLVQNIGPGSAEQGIGSILEFLSLSVLDLSDQAKYRLQSLLPAVRSTVFGRCFDVRTRFDFVDWLTGCCSFCSMWCGVRLSPYMVMLANYDKEGEFGLPVEQSSQKPLTENQE